MNFAVADSLSTDIFDQELETEGGDTVQHHGFSVWRIAQNMPNATPQQLDSVVQRYLPHRDLKLSQRLDTLSIPGVPGHDPTVSHWDDAGIVYKLGFFQDNPLLHPEIVVKPHGFVADPLPYRLRSDNGVSVVLIICFVVLAYVLRATRQQFAQQTREFFFPPREHNGLFSVKTTIETRSSIFMTFQLSMMFGLISFIYAQHELDLSIGQVSPYLLLIIYSATFFSYFIVKRWIYSFVNWIFFEKTQRQQWSDIYSYLFTLISILFFPLSLLCVYFEIGVTETLLYASLLLILYKLLLLYKAYTIFFNKTYCLLHLFAYLCTLELIPMLFLVYILVATTDGLIIKN